MTRSQGPHAGPQAQRGMGGKRIACHGTPAAEDRRGVPAPATVIGGPGAQSLDSRCSLGMPSEVEARQDPSNLPSTNVEAELTGAGGCVTIHV